MSDHDQQMPHTGLTLAALGVVFGDIGTSPLYAMRECFVGVSGFPVDHANVFGILSLITWSLVVIVSLKFVMVILRADLQGEGGMLALAYLVVPESASDWNRTHLFLASLGVFGAALLFGDGIITPALSVLSAMEGVAVANPALEWAVVPLTVGILLALFGIQRFGTGRVGVWFGPIMLGWFGVLAMLGIAQIAQHPHVLHGLNPAHAVWFFADHGAHGTLVLGAVFLVVTGAEAMYADLGHFGRQPIQRAWFGLAFPALLLNYFGQGALLLQHPELVDDVFFRMAPAWALMPLVALATFATVIASQAVISGVFSLTSQAIQLEYLPRLAVRHTAHDQRGQIYVPAANAFLAVGTIALVLGFRASGNLADAYGIAVSLSMVLTSVLMGFVMHRTWRWPLAFAVIAGIAMVAVELPFALSIANKVWSGGWVPLSLAVVLFSGMATWRWGRIQSPQDVLSLDADDMSSLTGPVAVLIRDPDRVPSMASDRDDVLFLHVERCNRPYMEGSHLKQLSRAQPTIARACFGFMEQPTLGPVLEQVEDELDDGVAWRNATFVWIRRRPPSGRRIADQARRVHAALEWLARPLAPTFGIPSERLVQVRVSEKASSSTSVKDPSSPKPGAVHPPR